MTTHVQQTLHFSWQGGCQCSLQLLIQPWICAPGTHYAWVDRSSVEYEVYPTLLHMATTGNRTSDLLILSPTPYQLGHMLPVTHNARTDAIYGLISLEKVFQMQQLALTGKLSLLLYRLQYTFMSLLHL